MSTLKPGNIVSAAVLDFFLSLESHQSQSSTNFSQRFHYLPQDTIHNLTEELGNNQKLLKRCLKLTNEKTVDCPFLFLVTSPVTPNTYFLVMFHFIQEKALVLGHRGLSGPDFYKTYGEWESWNGHTLWRKIYTALIQPARGFEEHEMKPTVYETDLIPVSNSMPLIYITLTLFIFSVILIQALVSQDLCSFSVMANGIGPHLCPLCQFLRFIVTIALENKCSIL